MKTIWKYPLDLVEMQTIRIPNMVPFEDEHKSLWGQIIHVGCQNNTPTLWAMVDTDLPSRDIAIHIVGTGGKCHDTETWDYLGTSVCDPLVWHIFARVL